MPRKFKVGDRVWYANPVEDPSAQWSEFHNNKTPATVLGHRGTSVVTIQFDGSEGETWSIGEHKLELPTPPSKLIGPKPEPAQNPPVLIPFNSVGIHIRDAEEKVILSVHATHLPYAKRKELAREVATLLNKATGAEIRDKVENDPFEW